MDFRSPLRAGSLPCCCGRTRKDIPQDVAELPTLLPNSRQTSLTDQVNNQNSLEFQREVDALINRLSNLTRQISYETPKADQLKDYLSRSLAPMKENNYSLFNTIINYEIKENDIEDNMEDFTIDTFIEDPKFSRCIRGISEIKKIEDKREEKEEINTIIDEPSIIADGSLLYLPPAEENETFEGLVEDSELRIKAKNTSCFGPISQICIRKAEETSTIVDEYFNNNDELFELFTVTEADTFSNSKLQMDFTIMSHHDDTIKDQE